MDRVELRQDVSCDRVRLSTTEYIRLCGGILLQNSAAPAADPEPPREREPRGPRCERIGTYEFGAKHEPLKETELDSKVRATAQLKELEMAELKCCGRRHQQAEAEAS